MATRSQVDCCGSVREHFTYLSCAFLAVFFILGFFTQGRWEEIAAESDPALQKLASTLPGIGIRDRAQSTVSTYLAAFQRWEKWALSFKFSTLPAEPAHLCLYFALADLLQVSPSLQL